MKRFLFLFLASGLFFGNSFCTTPGNPDGLFVGEEVRELTEEEETVVGQAAAEIKEIVSSDIDPNKKVKKIAKIAKWVVGVVGAVGLVGLVFVLPEESRMGNIAQYYTVVYVAYALAATGYGLGSLTEWLTLKLFLKKEEPEPQV